MKTRKFTSLLAVAVAGSLVWLACSVSAQNSTTTPTTTPQLAYGVSDIVKLAKANVSDDVITAYIKSSRSGYGLTADQILYLKQQGVSSAIITLMLNQTQTAVNTAPAPTAAPTPVPALQVEPPLVDNNMANATAAAPPPQTYVQPAPPVYNYAPDYYGSYYYPSYGYYGYYGLPYPVVGFGWGWHGHMGGGFHGGGGWHGGSGGGHGGHGGHH